MPNILLGNLNEAFVNVHSNDTLGAKVLADRHGDVTHIATNVENFLV